MQLLTTLYASVIKVALEVVLGRGRNHGVFSYDRDLGGMETFLFVVHEIGLLDFLGTAIDRVGATVL